MGKTKIFTVTELTQDVRSVMEGTFSAVWVEGEISNFTVSTAGHAYFSLKDRNSLLNCVLFKGNSSRVPFQAEDGMQVLCSGKISVYDKRGQYQLYVNRMEPRGRGALQLAFEQLKKKLLKEGLFDEDKKKPLPFLPVHIGVVTSPTGAAVRDILKTVHRRFANIEVSICPVRVQGDEAKHEIARAIEDLNSFNKALALSKKKTDPIDVIIVGRGGGSLEDLWAFNEEIVARAIYASVIPVISAVGHEIDYSISDFVADLRAPTPSAAAELVVPVKEDLAAGIDEWRGRLFLAMKAKIDTLKKEVDALRDSYVLRTPMNVFLQMQQQVDDLLGSAASGITHSVELKQRDLGTIAGRLKALSPLAVLERGYSIMFKDGKVVKTARSLKKGDQLRTKLAGGQVLSKVESVEE